MADKKFSQFDPRVSSSSITEMVGYDSGGNVNTRISPQNLIGDGFFMVTGTFKNMFGGDPGIFGDTLEFGNSASSASTHSSVFCVPKDCKLVSAGFKWISSTATSIPAGATWEVFLYTLNNPLTDSCTAAGNYTNEGSLGITLTDVDDGTTPGRFVTGLAYSLVAGDMINISGVETVGIGTSSQECEMTLVFQTANIII